MRQLMQCKAIRSLCYMLIIALVSTIAPKGLVRPASAQLLPTYAVGVVDFINESGVQGELLARLATDAVVVEMSKTNRYDVSITRSQMKAEMQKLDLRPPLSKLDLVRLGEALQVDAMLEGSIRSVQLSGSGPSRKASVTLVVQMIDQASGEIINGAVQTGTSSARVGYTADDDSLIAEAINSAAFLCVKTMIDYVIPEATIMMNIGSDQVMLNKGARDGIKPGMRMIVLRQKEIIGYIEVRSVSAIDSTAKVLRSTRGIQPQDKARAIYEMPTVSTALKSEPLPSAAPQGSGGGPKGSMSKIGRFLIGAAIVFGLASMFKGGRGGEESPSISAINPMEIRWDPSKLGHGKDVVELHVLRDDLSDLAAPVKVISDPSVWDTGKTRIDSLYGTGSPITVNYQRIATNPSNNPPSSATATVPAEPYGQTHTYSIRVLYKTTVGVGESAKNTWRYTTISNTIVATAIEAVKNEDIIQPYYDPSAEPPDVLISDLKDGSANFEWARKDGANVYYIKVEPVIPGSAPTWQSDLIYETGPTVSLPAAERLELANLLENYPEKVMKWRVYCRNSGDTSPGFIAGQENRFRIGDTPPFPGI